MPTFRKSGLTQAQYEGLTTHIDKLYTDCPPEMLNGKKTATKTASQEILSEEDSEVSETDSDNDIDNIDLTKLKTFFSAISSKTTIYTHLKECLDLEAPAFAFFYSVIDDSDHAVQYKIELINRGTITLDNIKAIKDENSSLLQAQTFSKEAKKAEEQEKINKFLKLIPPEIDPLLNLENISNLSPQAKFFFLNDDNDELILHKKISLIINRMITYDDIKVIDEEHLLLKGINKMHEAFNLLNTQKNVLLNTQKKRELLWEDEIERQKTLALKQTAANDIEAARIATQKLQEEEQERIAAEQLYEKEQTRVATEKLQEEARVEFNKQKNLAEAACVDRLKNEITSQYERIQRSHIDFSAKRSFSFDDNMITLKNELFELFELSADLLSNLKLPRVSSCLYSPTSFTTITKLRKVVDHDYLSMTAAPISGFAAAVTLSKMIKDNIHSSDEISANINTYFQDNPAFKIGYVTRGNDKIVLSSIVLRNCLKTFAKHPNYQTVYAQLFENLEEITPSSVKTTWQAIQNCLKHYELYKKDGETVSLKSQALITAISSLVNKETREVELTDTKKANLIQLMHDCHHYHWWINHQHPAQKTCSHIINALYGIESSEDCHELYKDLMGLSAAALGTRLRKDFNNNNTTPMPPNENRDNVGATDRVRSNSSDTVSLNSMSLQVDKQTTESFLKLSK